MGASRSPEEPASPAPPRSRRLRIAAVVGGLFALYTAFGFLAAPPILRRVLVKQASAALHRDVAVAKVRVNPLALSVAVDGLAVAHHDGAPFVAWESLYVRLAPWRLFAGDVGIAEIRLVRPTVHVGLDADGSLTFEDLLASGDAPAAAEPAKEEGGGLGVSIRRLAVEEARVTFRDATRRPAFDTALGPLTIRLEEFRTKGGRDSPYSFSGTTDTGETFRWTGTVRTQPLQSSGSLAFERITLPKYAPYLGDDVLPADLHDGLLHLDTRYELEWSAARRILRTTDGKVTVERLGLGPRGVADAAVFLPRIEVTGLALDALARDAKVGEVALRGGKLRVRREADGNLELARMAPPPSEAPWTWSVGAVAISGVSIGLEDLTTPSPVTLPLTEVQLRLEALRPDPAAVSPLSLSFLWNGQGKVAVQGSVQPFGSKGTLDLDATGLDLVPLAPYLAPAVVARLASGSAGAKARIGFDASGAEPRWTFAGDVRLDGLSVAEKGNDDLLRWRALEVSGIEASSGARRASVQVVRLVEPRAKAYVWEDGTTSVARALAAPTPTPAAAAPPARPAAAGPAWRTSIGAVQLVRGRAAFVDRSVSPPVLLNVTAANGKVTKLSSDPRVRSTVDVRLEVEGASPVRVAGTLNPLQRDAYSDLVVASEGVDLSPVGPYSGKFLGYGIQKGKLDLDLRYKVEKRNLAATNVVKVNQLTLGDATNSPDATKIPVRLALALLKDRHGVILLDVPVEGNLDDPEFHLGKVIWRTVVNLLVKVGTSPFKALAALAGGGEDADLSLVEFTPGTAEPLPEAQERLAMLAKSLAERPELALEVEGAADAEQDGTAFRRLALERSLRGMKAAAMRSPPASADAVTLTAEERARFVRAAFDAAFPPAVIPAKAGSDPAPAPPTPQEMEDRLAARAEVPPDAYRSLAAARAQWARDALLAAGLGQTRLFLSEGGERARTEKGPRVYFTVR